MTEEQKFWVEYKCPKCGYVSTVTDICRKCQRVMFATGFEEKLLLPSLRNKRRKVTEESEFYSHAVFTSNTAKNQCEEIGETVPKWAWFGVKTQ